MFDDTCICCGSVFPLLEIFSSNSIFFSLYHIVIYSNQTGFENFKPNIRLNHNKKMYKSARSSLDETNLHVYVKAMGLIEALCCIHHYNYSDLGLYEHFEQQLITASLISPPVGQLTTKSYM